MRMPESEAYMATDAAASAREATVGMPKRVDIISDTHGWLSDALLEELEGADLIIHAGDITSEMDWEHLKTIAPIRAVLGNNDYYRDYGRDVGRILRFTYEGLRFVVAHYRSDLLLDEADVGVCGHTHRAQVLEERGCLVVNPGSPTFPRGARGATMARMYVTDGRVLSTEILDLE